MNIRAIAASAALLSTITFAGVANAQLAPGATVAQAPAPTYLRGDRRSDYNIRKVNRRLHRLIAQLNHDQRDYGGHRVKAIQLLTQAEQELSAAATFDNQH